MLFNLIKTYLSFFFSLKTSFLTFLEPSQSESLISVSEKFNVSFLQISPLSFFSPYCNYVNADTLTSVLQAF